MRWHDGRTGGWPERRTGALANFPPERESVILIAAKDLSIGIPAENARASSVTGPWSSKPQGPPPPGKSGSPDSIPDPWGVRRAENLLTSLEGILSARVVTTPLGEVSEVHVLAQAGLAPKRSEEHTSEL